MNNQGIAVLEREAEATMHKEPERMHNEECRKGIESQHYCKFVPVITEEELCVDALRLFQRDADAPCIVICDQQQLPIGLLMRDKLNRLLAGRFAADLFYNRPALDFAAVSPLQCELSLPVSELLDIALEREGQDFYDSLIMTHNGTFVGVITVQDLMIMSRDLQKETDEARKKAIQESYDQAVEIGRSVSLASEASKRSLEESERMSMLALAGQKELNEVNASFSRVVEMAQSQNRLVSDLQHQAKEIASLVTQIRELADQSSLLAMNASIEAAHAGEHGRGFSIVANEVKKLAMQTKEFSGDIGSKLGIVGVLVNETAHATSYTVKEMEESHVRVVEAELTFGTLVASACQVENRGKEAFESTKEASRKNQEILHELNLIAGRN